MTLTERESDAEDAGSAGPDGRRPGGRFLTTSRLRWLLPAVLVLVWLAIGGVGGPFAGRLSEVQKNDASSFLPASAESTKVADLQASFADSQSFPAFLVVESSTRLTDAQLSRVRSFAASLPDLTIPVQGSPPVRLGDYLTSAQVPVVPAQDGKAALALINFDTSSALGRLADGSSPIQAGVEAIRAQESQLAGDGVRVYVAGPAGQLADLVVAFSGIDGALLGVALLAVLVILLLVYRSPVLPFFVIFTAVFALGLASLMVYLLADHGVITLDGQAQGILFILVVGAATDYSLLLVARYREELRRHDERYAAMRTAWRRTLEPVAASAGTVIAGLLCLLLSDLGQTRGLGPVGAIGVASSLLAALTFLPALLVLPGRLSRGEHGRWIFWPGVPHVGSQGPEVRGIWARVAGLVGSSPRRVWALTGIVLVAAAAFLPTFKAAGISQSDLFLTTVESVTGNQALQRHFPGGAGSPTVVIGPADQLSAATDLLQGHAGVAGVQVTPAQPGGSQPKVVDGRVQLTVTLSAPADSPAADDTVAALRTDLDRVSPQFLVGGTTAQNLDLRSAAESDRNTIIPVILGVIAIILALLLRSVVAPLLLLLANVLSFAATLGVSALVFNHVLDLPGADPSVPLYGFVFLVALGIDYSIFLMTRVREESGRYGTRPGVLSGLAATGGVITSAGVVLAATFAALAVLPIIFLLQIAFIVAFGVLLDTLVVRSLLVPALSHDLGPRIWWPSRLARSSAGEPRQGSGHGRHVDPAAVPE